MSMEIYAVSDERLGSIGEWQRAIDAGSFALELSAERPISALEGFLPVRWGGNSTGFECDHWDAAALRTDYADVNFGHRWKYALAFRWGADLRACVAAYIAGAAYAQATRGVVLDCEQGKILSPQQAIDLARDIDKRMPEIEAALRNAVEQFRP